MIKFLLFVVILFIAFLFGHTLIDIEGRIIIALPGKMIEMGIFTAIMFGVFGILAFWILSWFVTKLVRAFVGSRKWLGAYSRKQQTVAYYESITAILMNDQERALQQIRKTIGADFNGSNYLIAAELEAQNNNNQQAKAYLIQAMDSPKVAPVAKLKQAELSLTEQNPTEAMTLLSTIEGNTRKTKGFVLLKLRILEALNDWTQIQTVAKEYKKVLGTDYVNWASRCIKGEFAAIASKQGANALKQHWQSLPRGARKDIANQVVYIQLLIDQGLHAEAEAELVALSSKQQHQEHTSLFKQIILPNPAKAIKHTESQIKRHPDNAELYSVLANLAYNSGDYELARKALNKALELKPNLADKALLAKILEQAKDFQGANAVYQGLMKKQ
jgi:HemY protein